MDVTFLLGVANCSGHFGGRRILRGRHSFHARGRRWCGLSPCTYPSLERRRRAFSFVRIRPQLMKSLSFFPQIIFALLRQTKCLFLLLLQSLNVLISPCLQQGCRCRLRKIFGAIVRVESVTHRFVLHFRGARRFRVSLRTAERSSSVTMTRSSLSKFFSFPTTLTRYRCSVAHGLSRKSRTLRDFNFLRWCAILSWSTRSLLSMYNSSSVKRRGISVKDRSLIELKERYNLLRRRQPLGPVKFFWVPAPLAEGSRLNKVVKLFRRTSKVWRFSNSKKIRVESGDFFFC
ncbi:hypothetical protein AGDE_15442 [Angomonas deanei]|uniref:Uncharacterized protein n=1 Tax=Angomonas deanei TaxID=59799 RepID=A0A7G2CTC3_9TRYP|nr:hypothetical protein AGDE_15442 [Angomonas deanei]CAD2222998.1 hypothetical protein, conserved [Angomonas deanei]|eukprot:EPY19065.1 hypothetical protein AGDE_15442 [Angomonas deanei]